MSLEYFTTASAVQSSGLFIGVPDLPGLTAAKLGSSVPNNVKEARAVFSLLKTIFTVLSPRAFNKLGVLVGISENRPASLLTNRTYTYSTEYIANIATDSITPLPVPTFGMVEGLGKFSLADIFPTAIKVSAATTTPGAGILIQNAPLESYGAPTYADLDPSPGQDSRGWLAALFNWFTDGGLTIRSPSIASGIIATSRSTPTTSPLPTNATATTNPTTGLVIADISRIFSSSVTFSITIQTIDDLNLETFDTNVI